MKIPGKLIMPRFLYLLSSILSFLCSPQFALAQDITYDTAIIGSTTFTQDVDIESGATLNLVNGTQYDFEGNLNVYGRLNFSNSLINNTGITVIVENSGDNHRILNYGTINMDYCNANGPLNIVWSSLGVIYNQGNINIMAPNNRLNGNSEISFQTTEFFNFGSLNFSNADVVFSGATQSNNMGTVILNNGSTFAQENGMLGLGGMSRFFIRSSLLWMKNTRSLPTEQEVWLQGTSLLILDPNSHYLMTVYGFGGKSLIGVTSDIISYSCDEYGDLNVITEGGTISFAIGTTYYDAEGPDYAYDVGTPYNFSQITTTSSTFQYRSQEYSVNYMVYITSSSSSSASVPSSYSSSPAPSTSATTAVSSSISNFSSTVSVSTSSLSSSASVTSSSTSACSLTNFAGSSTQSSSPIVLVTTTYTSSSASFVSSSTSSSSLSLSSYALIASSFTSTGSTLTILSFKSASFLSFTSSRFAFLNSSLSGPTGTPSSSTSLLFSGFVSTRTAISTSFKTPSPAASSFMTSISVSPSVPEIASASLAPSYNNPNPSSSQFSSSLPSDSGSIIIATNTTVIGNTNYTKDITIMHSAALNLVNGMEHDFEGNLNINGFLLIYSNTSEYPGTIVNVKGSTKALNNSGILSIDDRSANSAADITFAPADILNYGIMEFLLSNSTTSDVSLQPSNTFTNKGTFKFSNAVVFAGIESQMYKKDDKLFARSAEETFTNNGDIVISAGTTYIQQGAVSGNGFLIVDAGTLWIKSPGTFNDQMIKFQSSGSVVVEPISSSSDIVVQGFGLGNSIGIVGTITSYDYKADTGILSILSSDTTLSFDIGRFYNISQFSLAQASSLLLKGEYYSVDNLLYNTFVPDETQSDLNTSSSPPSGFATTNNTATNDILGSLPQVSTCAFSCSFLSLSPCKTSSSSPTGATAFSSSLSYTTNVIKGNKASSEVLSFLSTINGAAELITETVSYVLSITNTVTTCPLDTIASATIAAATIGNSSEAGDATTVPAEGSKTEFESSSKTGPSDAASMTTATAPAANSNPPQGSGTITAVFSPTSLATRNSQVSIYEARAPMYIVINKAWSTLIGLLLFAFLS